MSKNFLLCGIFLTAAALSQAATIAVGTPGNSTLATPTGPTAVGTLINFDALAQSNAPVPSVSAGGAAVSSPDGVMVIPFSTMSYPNEVFDNGSNGTANLTVKLAAGTSSIGIGIADIDNVSIQLQALASDGSALGSSFTESLGATVDANGNSYFIISDATSDIFGVNVLQSVSNVNYSGLAIDDVQFAPTPEPSAFVMLAGALPLLGGCALVRRRRNPSNVL